MTENERIFKICLLGDGAVGKTSLRKKYMGEGFSGGYIETLGVDFGHYRTKIEGIEIHWSIWDLAGQPAYKEVRVGYYTGSYGAIAVYDVTRPYTTESLEQWIKDFKALAIPESVCVLVGNKIDLRTPTSFDTENGEKISKELDLPFIETSAKTGEGVEEAFGMLGEGILKFTEK